MLLPLVKSMRL
ncbi:hypothetical protein YPPY13_1980, partial [Yersinia pestis PY-13]